MKLRVEIWVIQIQRVFKCQSSILIAGVNLILPFHKHISLIFISFSCYVFLFGFYLQSCFVLLCSSSLAILFYFCNLETMLPKIEKIYVFCKLSMAKASFDNDQV